jgi:hypothetical protein
MTTDEKVNEILIATRVLQERQTHVLEKLDTVVPRAELDERFKSLEHRIKTVEGYFAKAAGALLLSGLGILGKIVWELRKLAPVVLACAIIFSKPPTIAVRPYDDRRPETIAGASLPARGV